MNAAGPFLYINEYDAIDTSGVCQPGRFVTSESAAKMSASFNPWLSARVYDA